jgi:TPR repeat protein
MSLVGRTAALHIAFWQYDPWYRRAWFVWPQATAILLAAWLVGDRTTLPIGKWAKPADCTNPSNPGCAATKRVMLSWSDEAAKPTIANQTTVTVDRSALRSSAAADQTKLSTALGAYYRGEWAKAVDTLNPATAGDPNVQFVKALALLIPGTTDQVRDAQTLLRSAAVAGQRQASVMLGRMLMVGWGTMAKDEQRGRELIEQGAAAGDLYAMRLAAIGYLDREFGSYDPVKAVDLTRKAAEAGEPVAMMQLAYFIRTGRGGLARDDTKVLDYLRRSAQAGYTDAQYTLARWMIERYDNRETEDPSEGFKWYERAYQHGYSFPALVNLARAYRFARVAPWFDTKRSFALLELCAPYAFSFCHYSLAEEYRSGAGTAQDLVKAYAHYSAARRLGLEYAQNDLQQLDAVLLPNARTAATQLAETISAGLKMVPWVVSLQSPEADSAGPSPWATQASPPRPQPAAPAAPAQQPVPPAQQPAATADWTACKGDDVDRAMAACTRLIASGISGTELGTAHVYKAWNHYKKQQYKEAIDEDNLAIQLRGLLPNAYNDRGVAYKALGNFQAAVQDFEKAAALGSVFATTNLGWLYESGQGVAKDYREARRWYEKGAQSGDAGAMTSLGLLYWRGQGVPRDYAEARRWYEQAAEKGNADGMTNLGLMYRSGEGVPKDYAAARLWFEQAASLGERSAINWLGVMYNNGEGVPQDYTEARRWYEKAAALGESWAMFNIGLMYEFGQGVSLNKSEARNWYQKAAGLGLSEAKQKLQRLR